MEPPGACSRSPSSFPLSFPGDWLPCSRVYSVSPSVPQRLSPLSHARSVCPRPAAPLPRPLTCSLSWLPGDFSGPGDRRPSSPALQPWEPEEAGGESAVPWKENSSSSCPPYTDRHVGTEVTELLQGGRAGGPCGPGGAGAGSPRGGERRPASLLGLARGRQQSSWRQNILEERNHSGTWETEPSLTDNCSPVLRS